MTSSAETTLSALNALAIATNARRAACNAKVQDYLANEYVFDSFMIDEIAEVNGAARLNNELQAILKYDGFESLDAKVEAVSKQFMSVLVRVRTAGSTSASQNVLSTAELAFAAKVIKKITGLI